MKTQTRETYFLKWIDAYLLDDNWETIENVKEAYPVKDYHIEGDGWVDCTHEWEFQASSTDEIKQIVSDYLDEIGRIVDVFGVFNSEGKEILTEEDF